MLPAVNNNGYYNYGLNGQPLQMATSIYQQGTPTYNAAIASPYTVNTQYGFMNAAPQKQEQSGPSFGLDNLSSGGNIVKNGFNLPQSNFINNAGAALGFSPGTLSYTAAGALPWQTAGAIANPAMAGQAGVGLTQGTSSALGAGTFSSALGAAGIGAFAGNFLGKIGGNSTGGSIGGAIGAGIGMAVGGPIGGVIGGTIGGTIGGFFGGKSKPTSASEFGLDGLKSDGSFVNARVGTKAAGSEQGQAMMDKLGTYMQSASKNLGIDFSKSQESGTSFRGGFNSLRSGGPSPYFLTIQGHGVDETNPDAVTKTTYFDPNNPDEADKAYREAVKAAARRSGYTDMAAIDTLFDQQKFDTTTAGKQAKAMPFIPIKDNQRFADFMGKFKTQSTTVPTQGTTPNANATPTT